MRADLEQKPEEDDLDWIIRLRNIALDKVSVCEADPEVVAILLNRIPHLVRQVRDARVGATIR